MEALPQARSTARTGGDGSAAGYPTMPALGGADRGTLSVTSASYPLRRAGDVQATLAGGLFALRAPAPGLRTSYMPS